MIITKIVLVMMIGFIVSICFSCFLIPFLKKKKADQRLSEYLINTHRKKEGTPTMGGLIFILSTFFSIVILYLFNKIEISYNFIIVLFTFLSYGLIGFVDDYLIIKKNNNKGLSEKQKIISQLIVSIIFFCLFLKADNEPLLWIHFINLKLDIGFLYGLFILFVLVASSNAVNITDGLDGLAGGLSVIAITTFGIILLNTGWLEGYESIALLCFLLVGSLLGFLIFNTSPAKIFMGDTGSLALGAILGSVAILSRHELLLVLIGIVFVIETTTCLIQRYYYKLTKKRFFLMTPIHHTFEKIGWSEGDIVKLFWVFGLLGSMLAIVYGVML